MLEFMPNHATLQIAVPLEWHSWPDLNENKPKLGHQIDAFKDESCEKVSF